ncbi:MAG: V4R domain-containing protein [Candidatus Nanohalobium sp.]
MTNTREALYELAPNLIDIDVDEKGVREYAGRRLVFIDTNVFAKMVDDIEDVIGPVIQQRVKDFGRNAGQNIGEKISEEFKDVSGAEKISILFKSRFKLSAIRAIKDTDSKSQMQKILGYGTFVGWMGKGEIKEYEEDQRIIVHIENTFESHSYGESGRKECRFFTGTIAGIMEHLWGKEVEAEELECSSESITQDRCVFEVKSSES